MFLRSMFGIMLVLIPPHCRCATAVSSLTRIGLRANAGTILVGTQGTIGEAQRLQSRLSPSLAPNVRVTLDRQGVLHNAVPAAGLTAVVISEVTTPGGRVPLAYASNLPGDLTANNGPLSADLIRALGR